MLKEIYDISMKIWSISSIYLTKSVGKREFVEITSEAGKCCKQIFINNFTRNFYTAPARI